MPGGKYGAGYMCPCGIKFKNWMTYMSHMRRQHKPKRK